MKFIDEVSVSVRAGDGGGGVVAWTREKFRPKGGPCGGNGGNGGAIILFADQALNTLIDFSFNPELRAENGSGGSSNQMDGRAGSDLMCAVPVGTQVFYNGQLVADLSVTGARWVAARGGIGGKGNAHFKSATNQAPEFAQPGTTGETFVFRLVLKSVADIGLIGLPNVGKSTLISKITRSHPKIADYPFTTIVPNLGVLLAPGGKRLVIADIPGLIPGAHLGKGLGIKFLKHIERTKLLLHLLDVSQTVNSPSDIDPSDQQVINATMAQYKCIVDELTSFSLDLHDMPCIVAFSKYDQAINKRSFHLASPLIEDLGCRCLAFSSLTGEGIDKLIDALINAA
ncbi:MAG: GTPase ObgE [Deltaproteobacteria bacterium]|nr:GTPase ObgE [Deltaproteobacteria bacterium]